jgi:hypothetical protein
VQKYGVEVGGDDGKGEFDQIKSFRRFLLFARDTIRFRKADGARHPLVGDGGPHLDLHRQRRPLRPHLLHRGFQRRHADRAGQHQGQAQGRPEEDPPVQRKRRPRAQARAHPVEDYFDDLSMHIVWEIYKRDFQLFKYDFENPGNKMPKGEVDLAEVHAKLGD